MEPEFWHQRWQRGEIGFHLDCPNPHLLAHWPALALPTGARVLVPLCGKSRDLVWLAARGHEVIGVELSPIAVDNFFREQHWRASTQARGAFVSHRAEGVEILCGDCFALKPSLVGSLDAIYDRAALVALPPELRRRYADLLAQLLPTGGQMLLVTFDYPQEQMSGPPFAVGPDQVRDLYGEHFTIALLASVDILDTEPRFRQRGLEVLQEHVFHLHRNESGRAFSPN